MRLGLLLYGSLEARSGGYLYDRQLVRELERAGDEVEIISLPYRSYPRHVLDNFSSRLLRWLAGAHLDLLLQDELNHPSLFLINRRLKRRVSYPVVAVVHHLQASEEIPLRGFYRLVERLYLKTVDGAIFNSPSTERSVAALAQIPGVVALPGGDHLTPEISAADIIRRGHQPGPLNVVFIGNLIPRKGLHTLLRALAYLSKEMWSLAIAGDPQLDRRYSQRMVRLCRALGIGEQVDFHGYRSAKEIQALLRGAHLLAVPSQFEGYGIAYLEGMGYGLPPLASAAGGAVDLVRHGDNGYLIHPGDSESLANIIRSLYLDRQMLLRLSLAARCTYEAHPTWSDCGRAVRSFLNNLVETELVY